MWLQEHERFFCFFNYLEHSTIKKKIFKFKFSQNPIFKSTIFRFKKNQNQNRYRKFMLDHFIFKKVLNFPRILYICIYKSTNFQVKINIKREKYFQTTHLLSSSINEHQNLMTCLPIMQDMYIIISYQR